MHCIVGHSRVRFTHITHHKKKSTRGKTCSERTTQLVQFYHDFLGPSNLCGAPPTPQMSVTVQGAVTCFSWRMFLVRSAVSAVAEQAAFGKTRLANDGFLQAEILKHAERCGDSPNRLAAMKKKQNDRMNPI